MAGNMQGHGRITWCTGKESTPVPTDDPTMAFITTIKNTATGNIHSPMVKFIKDSSKMGNKMDLGNLFPRKGGKSTVNGSKEKGRDNG